MSKFDGAFAPVDWLGAFIGSSSEERRWITRWCVVIIHYFVFRRDVLES